jgi:hypothetical protein
VEFKKKKTQKTASILEEQFDQKHIFFLPNDTPLMYGKSVIFSHPT